MENNLVSICCISYNHEKYIEFAIKRFFNQTYKNIEIIALDDGSNDSSVEILTKLSKESPYPFKIISQENSGNVPYNFNKTLEHANGKYVMFISLDDYISDNFVENKIIEFNKNNNLILSTSTNIIYVDNFNNTISEAIFVHDSVNLTPKELLEKEFSSNSTFFLQGTIWKMSFINQIGRFDDDNKGDDIVLRTKAFLTLINEPNLQINFTNNDCLYYRRHDNNLSKNNKFIQEVRADYYQKFWNDRNPPRFYIKDFIDYVNNVGIDESISLISYNNYTMKMLSNNKIKQALVNYLTDDYYKYGIFYKQYLNIPLLKILKYIKNNKKYFLINLLGIKIKI